MKFGLKDYKLQKIVTCFKKEPLVFVFNISNTNSKNWLKVEQTLHKYDMKCVKISNSLSKKSLENSIFKNINIMLNGNVCLIHSKNPKNMPVLLQEIIKLDPTLTFLGVKLNNKIYSESQILKIFSLDYSQNVKVFNNSLKRLLKFPYQKLKKKESK